MFKLIKNEKGAALAYVVLTMLVLMVLGTTTLNVSVAENQYSIKNEYDTQADYVAKAGADITARYIVDNPTEPTTGLSGSIGDGTYSTVVTYPTPTTVQIVSTGVVGSSTAQVTLMMSGITYQNLFSGIRQTGIDDLDLSAMDISYEDGSTVLIEANVASLEQITLDSVSTADPNIITALNNIPPPPFVIPDSTGFQTTLPEEIDQTLTFTGNYRLTSLEKANGQTLIFDTQGADQHIVVNTLGFYGSQGQVLITGGGNVHIYILDAGEIQTPVKINEYDPGVMFIYVAEGKTLTIMANGVVNAYIYAPDATVEIQSDDTTIVGSIVGQIINRGNVNGAKGNFHFVPLDDDPGEPAVVSGYSKTSYR